MKTMLRHVVLLRFKDETGAAMRAKVELAFSALGELPLVQALEWGTNVSPEGLSKGFTHCFFISFANAIDRDSYLPHVAHQAFVELAKPWLADVLVLDYQWPASA